ncbi:major facilitator protein [Cryptococcus deuterogattii 99/473]|uniref:Major facilitator protein n=1 Tax=Cryptococcus deuterogattii Ram5 TaxID=1296110 RepID=A0A0D0TUY2_9TREE|nr:major facilitator protein [Cryptococcus deuterogattii LA55]KIR39703.1 major facilitator protein [Cryptococcus deuterogattii Ram5]KIR90673.1 major facilitator protein [Cryptococcus deuterogattii CBS 10090]KIR97587.1 major facilitator protein [Cryptococcus deuterogattii 2001/935-1]KIY58010.1 major facilitator protein [Cryptococcus deuterogattii 99/473]
MLGLPSAVLSTLLLSSSVILRSHAFRVPISDTDSLREVCSGMYGGKDAYIEVTFDQTSSGQVALVIYEWKDVQYLGAQNGDEARTYICTTSAVRSGICSDSQLGSFLTSFPDDVSPESSSIFTTPLKFSNDYTPTPTTDEDDDVALPTENEDGQGETATNVAEEHVQETGSVDDDMDEDAADQEEAEQIEELAETLGDGWRKRQVGGIVDDIATAVATSDDESTEDSGDWTETLSSTMAESDSSTSTDQVSVPVYSAPITYAVPKTGYYCVGIVPVTLVNSRDDVQERRATHAEYSGMVLFRNNFAGELPAVEYPKIHFYFALSIVYFVLGCGWAYLCTKHHRELLPMQYYISGTIVFLIIEMLAQFAYYRYINKHGGGTASLAFLFVIAVLNAARNSLSFFLLLIVCMGLSVVTHSLGSVMHRVRLLTVLHFIFGVMYSVGTVKVELDLILFYVGTIMHLQARKQRHKLQMFQRLWRILVISVIAVAAFFVVSSMSLSNRMNEAGAIAYLWRPTRDNVRFSMSQELAQDEAEADAEDYEIDALENGRGRGFGGHQQLLSQHDEDYDEDERKGPVRNGVGEENVVFAMGDDSDEEEDHVHGHGHRETEYRDSGEVGGSSELGRARSKDRGKDD